MSGETYWPMWKLAEPLEVEVGQEPLALDHSKDWIHLAELCHAQPRLHYKYLLIRGTKRDKLKWEADGFGNHRCLCVTEVGWQLGESSLDCGIKKTKFRGNRIKTKVDFATEKRTSCFNPIRNQSKSKLTIGNRSRRCFVLALGMMVSLASSQGTGQRRSHKTGATATATEIERCVGWERLGYVGIVGGRLAVPSPGQGQGETTRGR